MSNSRTLPVVGFILALTALIVAVFVVDLDDRIYEGTSRIPKETVLELVEKYQQKGNFTSIGEGPEVALTYDFRSGRDYGFLQSRELNTVKKLFETIPVIILIVVSLLVLSLAKSSVKTKEK